MALTLKRVLLQFLNFVKDLLQGPVTSFVQEAPSTLFCTLYEDQEALDLLLSPPLLVLRIWCLGVRKERTVAKSGTGSSTGTSLVGKGQH